MFVAMTPIIVMLVLAMEFTGVILIVVIVTVVVFTMVVLTMIVRIFFSMIMTIFSECHRRGSRYQRCC